MKAFFNALTGALFVLWLWAMPAHASKKDDAWAACLWDQVPTTASNWLAMTPVKGGWEKMPTPPDYAIEWRLKAACFDFLKPQNKKWPPSFYGKNVRAALLATRPALIRTDKIEPVGFRCDLYFENDTELKNRAGFDWGVKAKTGDVIFQTMRYGFAGENKAVVQLTEGGGIRKCYRVLADGSMTDA